MTGDRDATPDENPTELPMLVLTMAVLAIMEALKGQFLRLLVWATFRVACHPKLAGWNKQAHLRHRLRWPRFACIHERRVVDQTGIEPVTS
jgi:hypothetical protein